MSCKIMTSSRDLVQKENRRRPSTEPYGTSVESGADVVPSMLLVLTDVLDRNQGIATLRATDSKTHKNGQESIVIDCQTFGKG